MESFAHFALDEVVHEPGQELPGDTRHLAILAALIGCQGVETYRAVLPRALDCGLTPVMVKETVYQAVDYLGMGRLLPFLAATNDVLLERGVSLPLEGQATTTPQNRLERGVEAQAAIFGDGMRQAWKSGHINRWLAANCFGDYYTRGGLDLRQRELITFCFLAAQGGCEPQLTAHARGNMNLGNDRDFLIRVVSQCLPYIGYPRSLNAIRCVEQAAQEMEKQTGGNNMSKEKTLFGTGGPNDAYAKYFTGQSYLNPLTSAGVSICNVTFEPGCRNFWHIHRAAAGGGQILLCTDGRGWYQAWGEPARELHPGDVVAIPAGVKHWHGAAKDSWFSHLSVEVPGSDTKNEWLEPVEQSEYDKLP
ncbi:carboxymuconolactone decarboxylase family protein [Clostridiales bacterium BX7]|uniref:Carboxymuconolactone decarboxylase family protein n=2 Tax=Feifania hominis TaxID=2763660 RepID=A0A926HR16_9FIRM|nr:carboxymuconolactone decarboxylase family protein [Feifania hominis]